MDRNREAQLRAAMQQFGNAVARGEAAVLDRFGSLIKTGDLVIWRPPHDLIFKVVDVKPVLDPRAQPGMIQMMFEVQVPVAGLAGLPNMGMILCGHSSADDRHTDLHGVKPGTPNSEGTQVPDAPLITLTDAPEMPIPVAGAVGNVTEGVFGANRGEGDAPEETPDAPPEPDKGDDDGGPQH